MSSLNLGIVAHVDAGKTSLTERLLFEAGALDAPGSVDAGTTRTDSLELERRRGITIRAAVTSFAIDDLTVNLVDTPGHPDFIAEVERSLGVLDAAVLVLSAVEGVQPQTVVIWRALQRVGVPTLLFVNKVDRAGADVARVVAQVRRRLTPGVVELARVSGEGDPRAEVTGLRLTDESVVLGAAESDDALLACWAEDRPVERDDVLRALRGGVRRAELAPVLCGSAVTGAGTAQLLRALAELPPAASPGDDELSGTVFAVDRDERGRRAWVRLWAGELHTRDRVVVDDRAPERVTELAATTPAGVQVAGSARTGQIALVRGPALRVGDQIGRPPPRRPFRFAPAPWQALVEPVDPTARTALFAALTELADEDPLIDVRVDAHSGEAVVRLHGEVQKEVLAALLAERYGVRARFHDTSVVCLERVLGTGASVDRIRRGDNPYLAGIGLRVEATPTGSGVRFSPGVERGNLPPAFIAATEEGVRAALEQGRHGWPVTDCLVTMTESGYWPRQSRPHQKFDKSISSVAADFRNLAPVVVTAALDEAGTRVCQPVDRFELDLPDSAHAALAALLGRVGAVVLGTEVAGGHTRLTGHLPTAVVPDVAAKLPDLTQGEGALVSRLDHHAAVTGRCPPSRPRAGIDPADRDTWFRHVLR